MHAERYINHTDSKDLVKCYMSRRQNSRETCEFELKMQKQKCVHPNSNIASEHCADMITLFLDQVSEKKYKQTTKQCV